MKTILSLVLLSGYALCLRSQSYTSYFTGDTTDIDVQPSFGIVLAGGATDNDLAMAWMLQHANGGDVVVIRASGSDGYNEYFYSELGIDINSVETILFNNATAALDPYVISQLQHAEVIFIAGGDQADYVNYWKNTPVENAINDLLNVRNGTVGGTSAGMAIQGGHYFGALNGSVYSAGALANPYNNAMTIGHHDFLQEPFLDHVITDTHYDDPDRRGRHFAFIARINQDLGEKAMGIACNEYCAVCIDQDGMAHCYGEYPAYEEYCYFLRSGCTEPGVPEICTPGEPLTWNNEGQALKVFKAQATETGNSVFDLVEWMYGSDGSWQDWYAVEGELMVTENTEAPACPAVVHIGEEGMVAPLQVFPNPASGQLNIDPGFYGTHLCTITDAGGRTVRQYSFTGSSFLMSVNDLAEGLYLLHCNGRVIRWACIN